MPNAFANLPILASVGLRFFSGKDCINHDFKIVMNYF